jgi:hypothetical protein
MASDEAIMAGMEWAAAGAAGAFFARRSKVRSLAPVCREGGEEGGGKPCEGWPGMARRERQQQCAHPGRARWSNAVQAHLVQQQHDASEEADGGSGSAHAGAGRDGDDEQWSQHGRVWCGG